MALKEGWAGLSDAACRMLTQKPENLNAATIKVILATTHNDEFQDLLTHITGARAEDLERYVGVMKSIPMQKICLLL